MSKPASRTQPAPTLMPVLAPGRHLGPYDGACLMEAASWLAGQRWTDRPRCTHPTLAAVARLVNDASSPAGRPELARLLPQLVGLRGVHACLAPSLVLACVQAAGRRDRVSVALRISARRARRRLHWLDRGAMAGIWCRVSDVLYRGAPAERALTRAVTHTLRHRAPAEGAERDRLLLELLERCVDTSRVLLAIPDADIARADRPVQAATPRQ